MKHVDLTVDERAEVLAFWRDFILSGGEGDPPSPFQMDALNDEVVRDTFLFWHVGGDPFTGASSAWADAPGVPEALAVLGPVPTNQTNMVEAMTKAIAEINASEPDLDSVDTATVLVLGHIMFGLLLKRFDEAQKLLTDIIRVNMRVAQLAPEPGPITHAGPLEAMAVAAQIISSAHREGRTEAVDQMLKDVFSVKRLPVLVDSRKENDGAA